MAHRVSFCGPSDETIRVGSLRLVKWDAADRRAPRGKRMQDDQQLLSASDSYAVV